jgi:hypothetical protein
MAKIAGKPTLLRTASLSAKTLSDINDLAFEGAIYNVDMFYSPSYWKAAKNSVRKWDSLDFPPDKKQRSGLPEKPGVYVFFLFPDLFGLPQASGLLYVGKATSLKSRISYYLGQIDSRFAQTDRPYVWRMVNVWHGYLKYLYTVTATVGEAESLEDDMLTALRPPANKQYSAEVGKRIKAFK